MNRSHEKIIIEPPCCPACSAPTYPFSECLRACGACRVGRQFRKIQMCRHYYGCSLIGPLRDKSGGSVSSESPIKSWITATPKSTPWVLALMQMWQWPRTPGLGAGQSEPSLTASQNSWAKLPNSSIFTGGESRSEAGLALEAICLVY